MPSSAICLERTVVASRCANVVAGAGSVRSSAGTYMAWTDVMEPLVVEVILSWSSPTSVESVGWYPTAEGSLPRSAETSELAWTNLKMLSMKRSTSWRSSSRKYSATVRAVRATRARAPGGSLRSEEHTSEL